MQNDKNIVLSAVKGNGTELRSASKNLKNDKHFILTLLK